LASSVRVGSFSPGGVPGMGTEEPSSGEVPGECRGLEQILHEHAWRARFTTRPEPSEGIDYFIVSSEDMMKLETMEFFL
jgi:hypothetical protein